MRFTYKVKVVLEAEYALMSFKYKDCQFDCFIEFNTTVASGYGDEDLPEYKVKGEPFIEGINFELTSVYANINRYDCELDLAVEKPSDIMRYKEMIAQGIVDNYLTITKREKYEDIDDKDIDDKPYYENPRYDLKLDELLGK